MSKKRILISYATAGSGHVKAAHAIKEAFSQTDPDASVDIIDSLDYMTAFFKWFYPRIYIFMVNKIPLIWGFGYYLLDNRIFYGLVSWMRHITNWLNSRSLSRYLRQKDYDVIISTHFLLTDVVSMEKKRIRSRLVTVITDFRSHSFWIAKGIDLYVVAHERTRNDLMHRYNIPEAKITVLGIPVNPLFSKPKDRDGLIACLGVKKGLFTVLIGSGGFGVGPVIDLVKSFKGISVPVQLLVVCGKNEPLCLSVENLRERIGIPITSYGFIDNMDELMEISHVIITKMGGMISSESLAKRLPLVSIAPIPGQETRNFNVLSRAGVVIEIKNLKDAPRIITRLYEDKELMNDLKAKIEFIRKPEAAYNIAKMVLGMSIGICAP